jgi:hypothetical protein
VAEVERRIQMLVDLPQVRGGRPPLAKTEALQVRGRPPRATLACSRKGTAAVDCAVSSAASTCSSAAVQQCSSAVSGSGAVVQPCSSAAVQQAAVLQKAGTQLGRNGVQWVAYDVAHMRGGRRRAAALQRGAPTHRWLAPVTHCTLSAGFELEVLPTRG